MDGARPLVERHGRSDLEIAIEEILQDKITLHQPSDRELAAAHAEAQGELEGALL
jgi:DNA-directed RNA polymerase subunit omega